MVKKMRIEDVVWSLLKGETKVSELNDYQIYYSYVILHELRNELEKVYRKYKYELGDYTKAILTILNKTIKELKPRATSIDICYVMLEVANRVSEVVSRKILEKLMLMFYREKQ